ncbi:MAG: hypothetical protein ACRC4L_03980 [Mycoplasma sp.]
MVDFKEFFYEYVIDKKQVKSSSYFKNKDVIAGQWIRNRIKASLIPNLIYDFIFSQNEMNNNLCEVYLERTRFIDFEETNKSPSDYSKSNNMDTCAVKQHFSISNVIDIDGIEFNSTYDEIMDIIIHYVNGVTINANGPQKFKNDWYNFYRNYKFAKNEDKPTFSEISDEFNDYAIKIIEPTLKTHCYPKNLSIKNNSIELEIQTINEQKQRIGLIGKK